MHDELDNERHIAECPPRAGVEDLVIVPLVVIALGEEPPLAYIIHHARWLVHHCLSVDSGCLRKEGGRVSRTAWPNWATWPCRPPRWNGHSFRRRRMSPRPARIACEANERILNTFAIGPGGTFIFEEENRATFLPQRRGASAKVVLACAQK